MYTKGPSKTGRKINDEYCDLTPKDFEIPQAYQSVEQNIAKAIENTIKMLGFDLVAVRLHGTIVKTLEVLIDRLDYEKVTIADCTLVSRNISTALDVEDLITGKYYLHVASAGLERPLIKLVDYLRFINYHVKVHLKTALNNKKTFCGVITKAEEDKIYLQTENHDLVIDYATIKKANLVLTDEMFKKLLNKK